MRKYLTLIEPSVLDKWLKDKCELSKTSPSDFKKHTMGVFEKYDDLLRIVASHVSNDQQFIGASSMVIAILECIEDSAKAGRSS